MLKTLEDSDGKIQTYTGKMINPCKPEPDLICIEDIAHALSNQCRFGGHTKFFYSVARHSVYVAGLTNSLEGLMHDAAEAYFADIPSPVKKQIPLIKTFEDKLMKCIAMRFNLKYPWEEKIKRADRIALITEWQCVMQYEIFWPTTPQQDKEEFLQKFNQLSKVGYLIDKLQPA